MLKRRMLFKARRMSLAAISLVLFPAGLYSQSEKIIILHNADRMEGRVMDGEEVRELIGNVFFSQDQVRVHCDRALQHIVSGKVLLTGTVVIEDDSVTIRAPRGMYHRDERRAEAFDEVILEDGRAHLTARYGEYYLDSKRAFFRSQVVVRDTASTITADSLTYFRNERRSVATGNVEVFNSADNVTIVGHRFEDFAPERFSRMTENPVLVQIERSAAGTTDTLVVRSRTMESYRDSVRRLVAIDSVEIVRSDLAAIAGLAIFHTEGDSIILRKSPVVWYQTSQISGDSINVYLENDKLRLVRVMGSAFAASLSDSLWPDRIDQLTGETIQMQFVDQELDRVEAVTRAISLYHLYEDTAANGLNKTSGDRLVMVFEKRKLSSIKIFDGVEGQYFPENLVYGHTAEYALPGFLWRNDRPSLRMSEIHFRERAPLQ